MRRSVQLITLYCVQTAAEEGSILAASSRVGMHHSALSRRIRELEDSLGVRLFDRHPGGVRPTAVGEQFLEKIRTILADIDGTLTIVEQATDTNRLAIGFEESVSAAQLVGVIAAFIRLRSKVGVRFQEACREQLVEALRRKEVDLLISFDQTASDPASTLPLWRDRVFVALSDRHVLAVGDTIEWTHLRGQPPVLADRGNATWCVPLLQRLAPSGVASTITRHDVGRRCLLALVGAGLGITLLREDELPSDLGDMVAIPLSDQDEPVHVPTFARWSADNTNPALTACVRFLRDRYRE